MKRVKRKNTLEALPTYTGKVIVYLPFYRQKYELPKLTTRCDHSKMNFSECQLSLTTLRLLDSKLTEVYGGGVEPTSACIMYDIACVENTNTKRRIATTMNSIAKANPNALLYFIDDELNDVYIHYGLGESKLKLLEFHNVDLRYKKYATDAK